MPRQSALQTIALSCLFLMQAWLVYRVETAIGMASGPNLEAHTTQVATAPANGLNTDDNAIFAAQINARLSALENRDATITRPDSSAETVPIPLDGVAAQAADRRLEAMLPKEPMTHEDLMIFQAQLGQLPATERHQLQAALSRAINTGRVRQKFN